MGNKRGAAYALGRFIRENPGTATIACGVAVAIFAASLVSSNENSNQPKQTPALTTAPQGTTKAEACAANRQNLVDGYNAAMAKKEYGEAAKNLTACAIELKDTALQRLRLDALTAMHTATIESREEPRDQRLWAINALRNVDFNAAQKYTKLEQRLKEQARAEIRAERRKRGVLIGMSTQEVLDSNWGRPERINRSTYSFGEHEQWVYGNGNYLYFKNGVLDSIQTSN